LPYRTSTKSMPLELELGAGRGDSLELPRPVEGPPAAPPDGGAVAFGDELDDLEREVRHRREQGREPRAHLVGRAELGEPGQSIAGARPVMWAGPPC
jgi:hypothetical protein